MVPCASTFLYARDVWAESETDSSAHVTPRRPAGPRGFLLGRHGRARHRKPRRGHSDERADDRRTEPDQVAGGRGDDRDLRHPRRRDPPGVRPPHGLLDPAHPGTPRAGCRPRRAGVRRRDRAGRRLHGDVRAGRDQPGHAAGRRAHGLRADGRDHRPGRRRADRHRRLPGGGHPRHHDADHQAQLPGHRPGRHPAHGRRGVLHRRAPAAPARCWSTSRSRRCRR